RGECEKAAAEWRTAMATGGVTDAIEFSCKERSSITLDPLKPRERFPNMDVACRGDVRRWYVGGFWPCHTQNLPLVSDVPRGQEEAKRNADALRCNRY